MDTLTSLLVPLMFTAVWGIFTLSGNLVVCLVALLFASLGLPLMFMEGLKLFWPCGLLLILMSTGLIVVFAYIVSLHSQKLDSKWSKPLYLSSALLIIMSFYSNPHYPSKIFHPNESVLVDIPLSLALIFLLLFLVVSFIRIVYSKGGGFRKKF